MIELIHLDTHEKEKTVVNVGLNIEPSEFCTKSQKFRAMIAPFFWGYYYSLPHIFGNIFTAGYFSPQG